MPKRYRLKGLKGRLPKCGKDQAKIPNRNLRGFHWTVSPYSLHKSRQQWIFTQPSIRPTRMARRDGGTYTFRVLATLPLSDIDCRKSSAVRTSQCSGLVLAGLAPSAEQVPLVIVLSTTLVEGALEFCNVCITPSRSPRRDHLHLSVAKPTDEGDRGAGAIGSPRDCDNRLYLRGNCHAVLDFRDSSVLNQGLLGQ